MRGNAVAGDSHLFSRQVSGAGHSPAEAIALSRDARLTAFGGCEDTVHLWRLPALPAWGDPGAAEMPEDLGNPHMEKATGWGGLREHVCFADGS
jgi:hypothetical protein